MDRLPDEVLVFILEYLEHPDLCHLQAVSSRYLNAARDNTLWKNECFARSRAESSRRRAQLLQTQGHRLVEIRHASRLVLGESSADAGGEDASHTDPRTLKRRALANWEPGYPGEHLDYYEEYIHRHGPVSVGWLDLACASGTNKKTAVEATGVGLLSDGCDVHAHRIVAPLSDGSVRIWDASGRRTGAAGGGGKLVGQSRPGLLSGSDSQSAAQSRTIMTATGAVECLAINSREQKGYFAVCDVLQEVDLATLQVSSAKQYPFPINALSEVTDGFPLTVGTSRMVHLYDPRDPTFTDAFSSDGELIGGNINGHARLEQPGPLSILHDNGFGTDGPTIFVAGRFTSILKYDRRFFPRLMGTMHSGARIASLKSLPYPFKPERLDLQENPRVPISALQEARSTKGLTMLAAAEYKGKGSLELYGLPDRGDSNLYRNRQTASASKLLSVAPHGGRIVFSDGDGNLKWVERDGKSHVRTFNINEARPTSAIALDQDASSHGIFSSSASEMPGQGDIVQKIIPTHPTGRQGVGGDEHSHFVTKTSRHDVNQSNLLIWTGDGALGMLGFGHANPLEEADDWHDALEAQAETVEQKTRRDAERQYNMAMRRALERNADEVRFVRGLGMGLRRP